MAWTYTDRDPGILLFSRALEDGAPMTFLPGQTILEVGCCETDWLERAAAAWPDTQFVGIDWRPRSSSVAHTVQANALAPGCFKADTFDGIVSLSAFEHFGLGHYSDDPPDPYGDANIIINCAHWLKPGGWLYFDVPWNPDGYAVRGTEYRTYDGDAIGRRLQAHPAGCWAPRWRGYVESAMGTPDPMRLLARVPTRSADDRLHYYVAQVWQAMK